MPAHALPTGTLTMFFSDIEGSTALLRRLGTVAYAQVLSAQRSIVRRAVEDFGGREMGTEGDSHFVVFDSAAGAVAAAAQAQHGLAGRAWPDGAEVRVRMGLHTGEPQQHEDGYVGIAVHRAARVAAAAHGGQVLLTAATWELVAPALPEGVVGESVGEHRLKDLAAPERLHRLVIQGVPDVTAPPRGLGTTAGLPQPNTALVGRADELRLLGSFLTQGRRLVTLVGAGGVGKTRLAVEAAFRAADDFVGGVHFVDLSAVVDAEGAWSGLAQVLPGDAGPGAAEPGRETVARFVADRACLLLLDNLEQVQDADRFVAELLDLAHRRGLVLVTSRQPVRLVGEQVLPVDPLPTPEGETGTAAVEDSPAVRLFLQHAHRVRPGLRLTAQDLDTVAEVCRTLDGLPLALELAAVRLRLLSPRQLLAGLGGGLSLVAREHDRPARQRSLRETVRWSYDLLDADAQGMLRILAVAPGGADLATAEALCGAGGPDGATGQDVPEREHPLDSVARLVDVGLLRMLDGPDGEPRVRLLYVVRQFALEALAPDEGDGARRRLAECMSHLALQWAAQARGTTRLRALDRLRTEVDNVREALAWCLPDHDVPPAPDRLALGLRTVVALGPYWQHHGSAGEGRRWLERAVGLAEMAGAEGSDAGTGDPSRRAVAVMTVEALEALQSLAGILYRQGESELAQQALERTVAAWRERRRDDLLTGGLAMLGLCLRVHGDTERARATLEESVQVAQRVGDPGLVAGALTDLGILETDAGSCDRAAALFAQAIAVEEPTGDVWGPTVSRANLAVALLGATRAAEAFDVLAEVVPELAGLQDTELTVVVLDGLAGALVQLGDDTRAAHAHGAAGRLRAEAGIPMPEHDRREVERAVEAARRRLGDRAWREGVAAGAAMLPEVALDDALAHGVHVREA